MQAFDVGRSVLVCGGRKYGEKCSHNTRTAAVHTVLSSQSIGSGGPGGVVDSASDVVVGASDVVDGASDVVVGASDVVDGASDVVDGI